MTAHSSSPQRGSGGDKRERILDAAERVFARRGFFSSRVSEIAREAGVADGTIYLYFKSKDELLISLFETRMERVVADLTAAIAGAETPREQLLAFLNTHATLVREHPELAEVLTLELRQSEKFMKEAPNPRFAQYLELLAGVIARGQERGDFSADVPPPVAARAIFGAIDELALAWLLGRGEKFDIVRAADWIGALTLRGLERRSP
jgi:TetR/AcrR family transcriptional regulator, fatty acid metabolism regulator protein